MKKNNFSAIIDLGHSKLRFGIFDDNFINLYSSSKKIMENDTEENYSKNINSLIIESEKKISSHIDDIIVMYDLDEIFSIDISIKKNFDKKVNMVKTSSYLLLEIIQLVKNNNIDKKIIHFNIIKYNADDKVFFNNVDHNFEATSIILDIKLICLPLKKYNGIINIFKKNNINVSDFYCSSYVKSYSYLNSFEDFKDLIFLDIGLQRSTILYFDNKMLSSFKSIPVGGNHISKDISKVLKISLEDAEKIKKSLNSSETEFSYKSTTYQKNDNLVKKIIDKNISIELLKKVILARVEEIFELTLNDLHLSDRSNSTESILILIGNGSKLLNKNSFHFEDRYNYKEISFYDENDLEICKAGSNFKNKNEEFNLINLNKRAVKTGIFERFFNLFSR